MHAQTVSGRRRRGERAQPLPAAGCAAGIQPHRAANVVRLERVGAQLDPRMRCMAMPTECPVHHRTFVGLVIQAEHMPEFMHGGVDHRAMRDRYAAGQAMADRHQPHVRAAVMLVAGQRRHREVARDLSDVREPDFIPADHPADAGQVDRREEVVGHPHDRHIGPAGGHRNEPDVRPARVPIMDGGADLLRVGGERVVIRDHVTRPRPTADLTGGGTARKPRVRDQGRCQEHADPNKHPLTHRAPCDCGRGHRSRHDPATPTGPWAPRSAAAQPASQ